MRYVFLLLAPALLGGCFLDRVGTAQGDTGLSDLDASAMSDGGGMDARIDAARSDAGVVPDSSAPDTGTMDTGTVDSGPMDAGTPDTGTPDTGPPLPSCPDVFQMHAPRFEDCPAAASPTHCEFYADFNNNITCDEMCGRAGQSCADAWRTGTSRCDRGAARPCDERNDEGRICRCTRPSS